MALGRIDFQNLSFRDQIKLARETDILLGVHGYALTIALYMLPQSKVIEIKRSTLYPEHQYRNLAHFVGIEYESFDGGERLSSPEQLEAIYKGVERSLEQIRKQRL